MHRCNLKIKQPFCHPTPGSVLCMACNAYTQNSIRAPKLRSGNHRPLWYSQNFTLEDYGTAAAHLRHTCSTNDVGPANPSVAASADVSHSRHTTPLECSFVYLRVTARQHHSGHPRRPRAPHILARNHWSRNREEDQG
jgi:hypothetical protein